jgi:hypothetical protein
MTVFSKLPHGNHILYQKIEQKTFVRHNVNYPVRLPHVHFVPDF